MKANKSTTVMKDTINIPINLYYQFLYDDVSVVSVTVITVSKQPSTQLGQSP